MKNVVCLISGRGSNLQALLQAAREEDWANAVSARIAAVVSSKADAPGLEAARAAGVVTRVVAHAGQPSREAFEAALAAAIDAHAPALVVLAGFMRVLSAPFVAPYAGRILNIHPSLLPAFPGLATHRRALEAGVRVHGCTVHFVSGEVDAGAIIAQAVVPVLPDDDEASLAARVLAQEHRLLPRCVRWALEGAVRLEGGRALVAPAVARRLAVLAA